MWWMACHGGAGATTLARMTHLGGDAGGRWPAGSQNWPTAPVMLVCRAHATGVAAATATLDQWRRGVSPRTALLGLVVVAASDRRDPSIVTDRLRVLRGWLPRLPKVHGAAPGLWRLDWVQALLAVDDAAQVGVPPQVAALRDFLHLTLRPRTSARSSERTA